MKGHGELKAADLIHDYCKIVYNEVKNDPGLLNPIFDAFKKTCLSNLYPTICAKHLRGEGENHIGDEEELKGFHPYCPPVVHAILCKLLAKVLDAGELSAVMDERLGVNGNYDLLLDIFCHTFEIFDLKGSALKNDHIFNYVGIKEKFVKYLGRVLAGKYMTKGMEEDRHKICIKAISSFFLLFKTKSRLVKLKVALR